MSDSKEQRLIIWRALSELYLDTELTNEVYSYIAYQLQATDFSLEEINQINSYKVFPALQTNLLSVAGIWSGFHKEHLIETITKANLNRNIVKKFGNSIIWNFLFKKFLKIILIR